MFSNSIVALAVAIASVEAASKGFNYGSTNTAGAAVTQSEFEALMNRAQNLQGTSGFNSARLYTMIQSGTTNSPIEAIPAAISTKTQLLLGMWASAGQADFTNEIDALKAAISQYGSSFTSLVTGLSVGSEDLYRDSVTGVKNNDGVGVGPSVIVDYINQVKSAIKGTALANVAIGHVDTWDAWTNSSNSAVISNVDWLGVDSYPYFETTVANAIGAQSKTAFFNSYNAVKGVSGGKSVWVTETGWPVSGPNSGAAVASPQNAEIYWQDVGCEILGDINTWWYTLQDAMPTTPSPSFGIIGSDLSSAPLYDLSCKNSSSSSTSTSTASSGKQTSTKTAVRGGNGTSTKTAVHGGNGTSTKSAANSTHTSSMASVSQSGNSTVPTSMPGNSTVVPSSVPTTPMSNSTGTTPAPTQPGQNGASQASSAIGAGILAIVAMVAAL